MHLFKILTKGLRFCHPRNGHPCGWGYLADKIKPSWILWFDFVALSVFAALFAVGISSILITIIAALSIATLLGIGNGTVFKLVPKYFSGNTGKATGIVGAIGGLGGFFPPLVMGAIYQATGSYAGGLWLLAGTCLAVFLVSLYEERTRHDVGQSSAPRGNEGRGRV